MKNTKINAGMVFERHEKKFMIPPDRFSILMDRLTPYAEIDRYGLHTISSIYYDTDDYSVIRHSLDKPDFKEKLRLRSYGVPGEEDAVYLELKKKLNGVTYKRRLPMTLHGSREYLTKKLPPKDCNRQILGEIDWYIENKKPDAKVLLSYDRIALFVREDSKFRITLDANIRWRSGNLDLAKGDYGTLLLDKGVRLMEIKLLGAFPLWLCEILSELEIYPCSFSKYGRVYTDFLINPQKEALRNAG